MEMQLSLIGSDFSPSVTPKIIVRLTIAGTLDLIKGTTSHHATSLLKTPVASHFRQRKTQNPHQALQGPACPDLGPLGPPVLPASWLHCSRAGLLVALGARLPPRSRVTFTVRPPLTACAF